MYRFKIGRAEIECVTIEELDKLVARYAALPPPAPWPVPPPPPPGVWPPPLPATVPPMAVSAVPPRPTAPQQLPLAVKSQLPEPTSRVRILGEKGGAKGLIPLREVGSRLHVSLSTVHKYIRNGLLIPTLADDGTVGASQREFGRLCKLVHRRSGGPPPAISRVPDCTAVRETKDAILVCTTDGRSGWVPKSVLSADSEIRKAGDKGTIVWQSQLGPALVLRRPALALVAE